MQGSPEDELLLLSKANSFLHSLEPNLIEEIYSNSTLFQDEKITSRQWLQMVLSFFRLIHTNSEDCPCFWK